MIIFALLQRRQGRAGDGEKLGAPRLGGVAIADLGETHDRLGRVPNGSEGEVSLPHPHLLVPLEAVHAVREQLQPHLAAYAVRSGDGGEGDVFSSRRSTPSPSMG